MKVSTIIPVFNVEKYLRKCLDSILAQTLGEIEIICVNDGSKDDSLGILREYEARDKRIIVITQENMGVESARAVGYKLAKGKFIHFCDPDDWCALDMYEKMYNAAQKTNADFVTCNTVVCNENGSKNLQRMEYYALNYTGLLDIEFKKPYFTASLWNKFFRKSIIDKHGIKFPYNTKTKRGFDEIFTSIYALAAKTCYFIPEELYTHTMPANSLMQRVRSYKSELHFDNWYNFPYLYKYVEDNELDQSVFDIFLSRFSRVAGFSLAYLPDEHKKAEAMKMARDFLFQVNPKYGNPQKILSAHIDELFFWYFPNLPLDKTSFKQEARKIYNILAEADILNLEYDKKGIIAAIRDKNYKKAYALFANPNHHVFNILGIKIKIRKNSTLRR